MTVLNLREPVSALTHGAWFLMIVPAAVFAWRRGAGNSARQISLFVYTFCLAFCAFASTLYHSVPGSREQIRYYLLLDHIGIFLLIAGTCTPIAVALLHGAWRQWCLIVTWGVTAFGIILNLWLTALPNWLSTGIYLAMGWGSLLCYLELARYNSQWTLSPIPIGGIVYSIGAVFHLLGWPNVWPGVVGSHELFHVFVMAASAIHFGFIVTVVANAECLPRASGTGEKAAIPRPVLSASGASIAIENPRLFGMRVPHVSIWFPMWSKRRTGGRSTGGG